MSQLLLMRPKTLARLRYSQLASYKTTTLPSGWSMCWLIWVLILWKKILSSRRLFSMQLVKVMPRSSSSCVLREEILSTDRTSMGKHPFTTRLEKVIFVRHSSSSTSGQASTTPTPRIKDQSITQSMGIAMKWSSFWLIRELTCRWRTKKVSHLPSMPRNKTN